MTGTPCLKNPVTETEVEERIRLGRNIPRCGGCVCLAPPCHLARAAAEPRLYPAQEPYAGHPCDALFNEGDDMSFQMRPWGWREKIVLMVMGMVAFAAVLGIIRGLQ